MSRPEPARDAGLQPERTRLAWRRTTLAVTVVTLLAVRHAFRGGSLTVGDALVIVTPVGLWIAALLVAHRRIAKMAAAQPAAARRKPALFGLIVAGYALLGLILVLR